MSQNAGLMVMNRSVSMKVQSPWNVSMKVLPPSRRKGRAVLAERLLFCLITVLSRGKLLLCPGKTNALEKMRPVLPQSPI